MSNRLDQQRQISEEPKRIAFAIIQLKNIGIDVTKVTDKKIEFYFQGGKVMFWPYSGWASGKTIKNGRGIHKLIKQVKPNNNQIK